MTVTPNDAENVFITLTARQMRPNLVIVSRAENASTPNKLRQAGADHIVMPAAIGAHRIVSLLTNPGAVKLAELVTDRSSVGIEMEESLDRAQLRLVRQESTRRRHQTTHRSGRDRDQTRRRAAGISSSR